MSAPPPVDVLRRYGLHGPAEPLSGGRGSAWRAGTAVLKPLDMDLALLHWQEDVLTALDRRAGFRVAPPIRATDGALTVDGWTAWRCQPGRHERGRWGDIIDVGTRFHHALRACGPPPGIHERTDPWAIGDRVAWGEQNLPGMRAMPFGRTVGEALRPLSARAQVVHGDLTGNVLFERGRAPAVIDLSPYWRPPGFATAIVLADALVWEGAPPSVVDHGNEPELAQYLLRALVFRAVPDFLAGGPARLRAYEPAAALASSLARRTS